MVSVKVDFHDMTMDEVNVAMSMMFQVQQNPSLYIDNQPFSYRDIQLLPNLRRTDENGEVHKSSLKDCSRQMFVQSIAKLANTRAVVKIDTEDGEETRRYPVFNAEVVWSPFVDIASVYLHLSPAMLMVNDHKISVALSPEIREFIQQDIEYYDATDEE